MKNAFLHGELSEEGLKLCVEPNQVSTNKGRYQRLVGRLMCLAHTRPDLAYVLSIVSQYMHNPREQHMNAVMRILRYLKNAPGKGILFAKKYLSHPNFFFLLLFILQLKN